MKQLITYIFLFIHIWASSQTISSRFKVDQFGYLPTSQKIAIISSPQSGYNSPDSYVPPSEFAIVNVQTEETVFSVSPVAWNNGAVHSQSGDIVWWLDFSDVSVEGEYYILDSHNNIRSYSFFIDDDVYNVVLRVAMKFFYIQRCGVAKVTPYIWSQWTDEACHIHAGQDLNCRLVTDQGNAATERDLSGGWHDAGDFNKYVTFTTSPLHELISAYEQNPDVFTDDFNIPESGNGVPDILDEIKWEVDWLLKMQTASGAVLSKVSVTAHQGASPVSDDTAPRFYGDTALDATEAFCGILAHAYMVFKDFNSGIYENYADTLLARAIKAWNYIEANPGYSNYTNQGFASASTARSHYDQNALKTTAACYLFAATGQTKYKSWFDDTYADLQPIKWTYWYPYESTYQDALLYYCSLTDATETVKTTIYNSYKNAMAGSGGELMYNFKNNSDAYRAYLKDNDYVWGSNSLKCRKGSICFNNNYYSINPVEAENTQNAALGYLQYIHGVNPIGMVMLTNMRFFGAEKSANEMYHIWFADKTKYDNALISEVGPPFGYLTGGPNKDFKPAEAYAGPVLAPPLNQPVQKAYKDWNTSWPENSWEITEPAIYYQASYIKLLSNFATSNAVTVDVKKQTFDKPILSVYPNPFVNQLNISGTDKINSLTIYDMKGILIFKDSEVKTASLDLGFLNSGVYYAEINCDLGVASTLVIKK